MSTPITTTNKSDKKWRKDVALSNLLLAEYCFSLPNIWRMRVRNLLAEMTTRLPTHPRERGYPFDLVFHVSLKEKIPNAR